MSIAQNISQWYIQDEDELGDIDDEDYPEDDMDAEDELDDLLDVDHDEL